MPHDVHDLKDALKNALICLSDAREHALKLGETSIWSSKDRDLSEVQFWLSSSDNNVKFVLAHVRRIEQSLQDEQKNPV
jgi:hypothetical protein